MSILSVGICQAELLQGTRQRSTGAAAEVRRLAADAGDYEQLLLEDYEMIYRSRKRWGEPPQRRRKQAFYAVVKPRNEAEKRAALQDALNEIEAKFGAGAVKRGSDV